MGNLIVSERVSVCVIYVFDNDTNTGLNIVHAY
jgi:hypothetical protein